MKIFCVLMILLSVCLSCDNADSFDSATMEVGDKNGGDKIEYMSPQNKFFLEFDIYTEAYGDEKYYTLLIMNANALAIYDRDPFLYYRDDNDKPVIIAESFLYQLYQGTSKIWFDERGLTTSVPDSYDMENDIVVYGNVKIGEKVAVFASKEKYTNEDLKAHEGDSKYFEKVSESFECCYITTLKTHTTIGYGMWSPDWFG